MAEMNPDPAPPCVECSGKRSPINMLRISKTDKQLTHLRSQTLIEAGILERYDLQECLFNSFDAFCEEIQENLEIVGKEVQPSEVVRDQIDLLAIDEEGNAVIVELKRGNDKLQLLQAVGYAAMISKWGPDDFETKAGDRWTAIKKFLAEESTIEVEDVNQRQRIILVAEQFDYEVLITAEWLHERYNVDISCVRLDLAVDDNGARTKSEYLALTQVYPTKELEEIAVRRGWRGQAAGGTAPARPESLSVIAAYNDSAPPDLRAEGTARNFRIIHPADWPFKKFPAYDFHWKEGGFVIYLRSYPDDDPQRLAGVMQLDGKRVANGQASLVWDQQYHEGRGRLVAKFPSTTPAETVAQAMTDLIALTRTTVANTLKGTQPAGGSTGN